MRREEYLNSRLILESSFSPDFYSLRESLFLLAGDTSLVQGCGAGSEWEAMEGLPAMLLCWGQKNVWRLG